MMDRNEILANFQAVTGIDDITECIAHLEQSEWNLNDAVQVSLLANSNHPSPRPERNSSAIQEMFPQLRPSSPIVSAAHDRMIEFIIKMGPTTKHIILDESAVFSTLRSLAAIEFEIPESETRFEGWPSGGNAHLPDDLPLATLRLPAKVPLHIPCATNSRTTEGSVNFTLKNSTSDLDKLRQSFILEVTDKRTKKVFNLTMPGSKTFEELRCDAHSLTDIPPVKQVWEGLSADPELLSLDRALGSLNLQLPIHKCKISSNERAEEGSDMDVDEFDEATEDFLYSDSASTSSRLQPMMPNEATDEYAALSQFQSEFNNRYGADALITPSFYLGTLDGAIQEAFGGAARNRRLLSVYLHHDKSIQSNVFCSQLLCAPSTVEYMANHCVIWAWDVTSDFNKQRLLDMCSKHFGSAVSATVKRVSRDGFPILVLAQGRGRSCEVNTIIQGNTSLDELTVKLIHAVEGAETQKQEDIRMEELSEARERIKREQEQAYEESLKQDKEKQVKLDAEKAEMEKREKEVVEREREKDRIIRRLTQEVPAEPDPKCVEPVSKIRFRPPSGGEAISRTFLASDKLESLLNYVGSLGYLPGKYRVITSYPKRDVSSLDRETSLKDHKLYPQETLIIEEIGE